MKDINWGMIKDGANFQSLVQHLVFSEDPKAKLFGRPGKDSGMDVLSGDGKTVFQAKFHKDSSAVTALFSDVKKEFDKIKKYKTQGDSRFDLWKDIENWILVTNVKINPSDEKKWDEDVVPVFASIGITAKSWNGSVVAIKISENNDIYETFFENETRIFLTLPEVRKKLLQEQMLENRVELCDFFGRDDIKGAAIQFLDDVGKDFFLITGQGGIGKTRLMYEIGIDAAIEKGWQVLWGNVESMTSSSRWFQGANTSKKTLLLLDEPEDTRLLKILLEQLKSTWKVVVSLRSGKSSIFELLNQPRKKDRVDIKAISILDVESAKRICRNIISTGTIKYENEEKVCEMLSSEFYQHPIFIYMAFNVLEKNGDLSQLPEKASGVAEYYLKEAFQHFPESEKEMRLNIIRWVAVLGKLNRDNKSEIEFVGERVKISDSGKLSNIISDLIKKGIFVEYGAWDRLVSIKPDVIRDYILLSWLTIGEGTRYNPFQPSEEAKKISQELADYTLNGEISSSYGLMLESIARTGAFLRYSEKEVNLLQDFFEKISAEINNLSASKRIFILETVSSIAGYCPEETVKIAKLMKENKAENEKRNTYFGEEIITQDDIIPILSNVIYNAAYRVVDEAKKAEIVNLLCELIYEESKITKPSDSLLKNNGQSASKLMRIIDGSPAFESDYNDVVFKKTVALLAEYLSSENIEMLPQLETLLSGALSVQKNQFSSDGYKVSYMTKMTIPETAEWRYRKEITNQLKTWMEQNTSNSLKRIQVWKHIIESHTGVNYLLGRMLDKKENEKDKEKIRQLDELISACESVLKEGLEWVLRVITEKKPEIEELKTIRGIWDWHNKYDENMEIKGIAQQLEKIYQNHDLTKEFEIASDYTQYEKWSEISKEKAKELAESDDLSSIYDFIERAKLFFGEKSLHPIHTVFFEIGVFYFERSTIQSFITNELLDIEKNENLRFEVDILAGYINDQRNKRKSTSKIVEKYVELANSEDVKRLVINRCLRYYNKNELFDDEISLLKLYKKYFKTDWELVNYQELILWTIFRDLDGFIELSEEIKNEISDEFKGKQFVEILNGIEYKIKKDVDKRIADWLLEFLLDLPDIDKIGYANAVLERLLEKTGKPEISWLNDAFEKRDKMHKEFGYPRVRCIPTLHPLSRLVKKINEDDIGDKKIKKEVERFILFNRKDRSVGFYLPEYVKDIDPDGFIFPSVIAEKINDLEYDEKDGFWPMSRFCESYEIGTQGWRIIAKPLLEKRKIDKDVSLFLELSQTGRMKGWSAPVGTVAQVFYDAVEKAKELKESEKDSLFSSFWDWYLDYCNQELDDQEELMKEERGE